ncbi:hypothetical protein QN277_027262 [Acacia crassicarpa]|uniref:RNA helicase n=1 Tax=Acacia crassicarpa TaxID=499986 RepID=A0AAE1MIR2_9FABA|nr:hypothetical protein QN277_027262 [Acacia crassicarpa]
MSTSDEECSVIGSKADLGFLDFLEKKSVYSYAPNGEDPIVISVPFPLVNEEPQSVCVGQTSVDVMTIKNTTNEPVELWSVHIFASSPEDCFTLSLMEPPSENSNVDSVQGFLESFSLEDRMLQPNEILKVWLSCKTKELGLHSTIVYVDAGDERIERRVFLLAEDKISQSLASKKPFSKGRKKEKFVVNTFVAGSRPQRKGNRAYTNRLPTYDIPKEIRDMLESNQIPDAIERGLTRKNYSSYFKTLVMMEELQLEEDMRTYDMECVTLRKKRNQFLSLEVPGLAERRPSLVHGDYIFAKLASEHDNDNMPAYQGFVHRVEADEVHLKFDSQFHFAHNDGDLYNVHFAYNRLNMRRLYQAIEAAENLGNEFLFPHETSRRRRIEISHLVPISGNINEEQMLAIKKILGCKGAPPYLIHGPPGTGKTSTIVEAVLQLYKNHRKAHILVCAPSNSAADYLLEKLLGQKAVKFRDEEIFRLNASTRSYEEIKPELMRFCYFDECVFKCPPANALMQFKIIVSTYMSVSLLYAENVLRGHFSHIFLDEASQASEPETMIPISHLCKRETVVILAGDPMQLGPVIYSKEAESNGSGKSYLERLFECDLYSYGDNNYITRLVRNYRCHPQILHLPSKLFYDGELIACKEDDTGSLLLNEDFLPNKEFPVLFFGIQGCDEREGSNPSWFNRIEVSKVIELVKKLTTGGNMKEEDIGIITPYRQQVLKIKQTLESIDLPEIKVGSVEQFQGQERRVIIISTVRSTIKHNDFDRIHCLGFLSNHRRFNVAITRAISLLIIIGNPHIISQDYYWHKLLWHCVDNSSYLGCSLPERLEIQEDSGFKNFQENSLPSEDVAWGQEDSPQSDSELPKPAGTDEAEWSDGWK